MLNQICGSIDDAVRDPLVLSIFHASLVRSGAQLARVLIFLVIHVSDVSDFIQEGHLWVLLDGGPSRAFSDSDIALMEDDLRALKVFDIYFSVTVERTFFLDLVG